MNPLQRVLVTISALVILFITLFPPWLYVYHAPRDHDPMVATQTSRPAGFHLIFQAPAIPDTNALFGDPEPLNVTTQIDRGKLGVEFLGCLLVTGLFWLVLKRGNSRI